MDGDCSPTKEGYANERLIAYTLADCPEYCAWLSDLFAPLKRPPQIAKEHDITTGLVSPSKRAAERNPTNFTFSPAGLARRTDDPYQVLAPVFFISGWSSD